MRHPLITGACLNRPIISNAFVTFLLRSPCPHRVCELRKHNDRRLPVDAAVRDTNALFKGHWFFGRHPLAALMNVGFNHHANDSLFALSDLVTNDLSNLGLIAVIFLRISVRAIYHEYLTHMLLLQCLLGCFDALWVKVGAFAASSQDDEAVLVTA